MTPSLAIARLAAIQRQVDAGARLTAEDHVMVADALRVVESAVRTPKESAAMRARLRKEGVL